MEDIDKLADQYPQYKELLRGTRERIKAVDAQIEQLPEDQPQPVNRPPQPGGLSGKPPGSKAYARGVLEEQKQNIRTEFDKTVDESLSNHRSETRDAIKRDLIKVRDAKEDLKIDQKDMNASQEFAKKEMNSRKSGTSKHPVTDALLQSREQDRDISKDVTKTTEKSPSVSEQLLANSSRNARKDTFKQNIRSVTKDSRDYEPEP